MEDQKLIFFSKYIIERLWIYSRNIWGKFERYWSSPCCFVDVNIMVENEER